MTDTPQQPPASKASARRASDEANLSADARRVHAFARGNVKDFVAADKGAKHKRVSPGFVDRMGRLIADAQKARGAAPNALVQLTAATRNEETQRSVVSAMYVGIRDTITTTYHPSVSGDGRIVPSMRKELFKAVGVGAGHRPDDTNKLLALAGQVINASEDDTFKKYLTDAGIKAPAIKALAKAHDALADADTVQNAKIGLRKGGTATKKELFGALTKATAFVRATGKTVFRGKGTKLKELESSLPKRAARKKG